MESMMDFMKHYGRCIKRCGKDVLYPLLICKDGYSMSVQASDSHSSTPKKILDNHAYEEMEVFVGDKTDSLLCVFQSDGYGTYSYVPVVTIDAIIKKHGGVDTKAVEKHIKQQR